VIPATPLPPEASAARAGAGTPLAAVTGLGVSYRRSSGSGQDDGVGDRTWAVRGVDLRVRPGEIVGLVGGSGSGKSTLARCVAGLQRFQEGRIAFDDGGVLTPGTRPRVPRVRGVQMAYQDPTLSLNPRRTVGSILREILAVHGLCPRHERAARVAHLLDQVGLPARTADLTPAAMSGGMCQRVAIARALALQPRLLVADEVVSALDASVQAQVLNLLLDTRDRTGIGMLFITHDLAVVNQVCDQVVVLERGRVVETGEVTEVLGRPRHDYTRRLMAAADTFEREGDEEGRS
jgi:ABC-type glutathione transport system ATPase component